MNKNTQKVAVLRILRQCTEPVALPELLSKLGVGYAERSVRRWVNLLIDEGLVERLGQKRGARYRVIDVPQVQTERGERILSDASEKILEQLRQPLSKRDPVTYNALFLERYQPNRTFYLPEQVRQMLSQSGQRLRVNMPAGTYARKIYNHLLIDLSYNSSRLEGNTYSLLDTKKLLEEGEAAAGRLNEEAVMILNHKDAIRYLIDKGITEALNKNIIFTMHYLLSDGLVSHSQAGKIRDEGVRIGGSTYVPYEQPRKLEKLLEHICQKANEIADPFEQSFFLLVHISYLQAFIDVNKRTARLCANIPLVKHNLVPLAFKDIEVDDYMLAMLAIYEFNQVGPLADLYVHSYLRGCKLYDITVEAIGLDEIRVRYRKQRREILRYVIDTGLVGKEMWDYIEHEIADKILKVDQAAVREDLEEDLCGIDVPSVQGLGISLTAFKKWQKKRG